MRLKRLDIIGFKSFMDKTVIQFDRGITGVVGPNGCGKSNIVDAIRWVLGEQSPKHLRGAAMSDVIFNGSQSRPPLGMSEVTLTFYNDQPQEVPARYQALREIAVTRRLFRTGESEYLVNKTPCRLLDITDLFLGTGVGTKAYSIIEQGRIGLIVSAKPDDRRSLIEEAAGITRYKHKKRAAERKMEHTRANLLRVGDLVGELGKRLDSLNRQARKAERYKKLREELREIELHLATHRWLEVTAIRRQLRVELDEVAAQSREAHEAIEALEGDLKRRRARLAEEETRLADVQSRAAEAEGQAKVHEERVSGLERERESLTSRTTEAKAEIVEIEARLGALAGEREQATAALAELSALIEDDQARLGAKTGETDALAAEIARLTGLVDAEREGALDAVRTLSEGKSHLEALREQRADVEARDTRGGEERAGLEERIAELDGGASTLTETLDDTRQLHLKLEEDRRAQETELVECKTHLEESLARIAELKDQLAEKKSRMASLQEIMRNYEGYQRGVRSVMLERDDIEGVDPSAIVGLVADVVHADPTCEMAVEAVLDARLQWVLVRDRETARRLSGWLATAEGGRSSFVPVEGLNATGAGADAARALASEDGVVCAALDAVRTDAVYQDVVRLLLGDVVVTRDLETAARLSEAHPGLGFVTLAGEVLAASGVLTGGTRDGAGTGLLEARREVDDLGEAVKSLERELALVDETRRRLVGRQAALETALDRLTKDSHAEQINIVTHEKELHRLADERGRLDERVASLVAEHADNEVRLGEIALETERTLAAIEAAEADQTTREARLETLGEELQGARAAHVRLVDEVTQLKIKAAADAERAGAAEKDLERNATTARELGERLDGLRGLVDGSGRSFESIASRIESDRGEAGRLLAEAGRLRTELARARETVAAAARQLETDEGRLDALRRDHETLGEHKSELGMEDRELELELTHLAESVAERHAVELEEALETWHLAPPPTDGDVERMGSLRAKIERMGEVNLTAISEFEEISTRHGFLSEQKADLERSLDQLQKAIQKINRTSKARFLETFELVNERFQKIFPRLFNGGKASLALTDPSSPLETGVEIFAQPPGKKLQSVSLLSGGEKALTAVSLLFGIFLVRPTPFCLLDEVDAPLDDNNVGRYNALVGEMAGRSQFILITHNKTTMEVADTLYGVTMEEPGCSKLVSVRLRDETPEGDEEPTSEAA